MSFESPTVGAAFSDVRLENAYHLLRSRAIVPDDPDEHGFDRNFDYTYTLDVPRALSILSTLKPVTDGKREQYHYIKGKRFQGRLKAQAAQLFEEVTHNLTTHELVPSPVVRDTERLLTAEHIEVEEAHEHSFIYLGNRFPQIDLDRVPLMIGSLLHQTMVQMFDKETQEIGISLSPEQIQRIVLKRGLSHEYGHALYTTLRLLLTEKRYADRSKSIPFEVVTRDVREELEDALERSAKDPQLDQFRYPDPKACPYSWVASQSVTDERFATGLELVGLDYALEAEGVSQHRRILLLESMKDKRDQTFNEFLQVKLLFPSKRVLISQITRGLYDLSERAELRSRPGLRKGLPTWLPDPQLGYLRPLNKANLRQFFQMINSLVG